MKRGTSAARGLCAALLVCILGGALPAGAEPPSGTAADPPVTQPESPRSLPRTVGEFYGGPSGALAGEVPDNSTRDASLPGMGGEPQAGALPSVAGTAGEGVRARPGALRITFGDYLRVLGWLVVVVALAVGCIWVLRRLQVGVARLGGQRMLEVVARTSLGPKHQLVLVRVAQRVLVVGTGPDGVTPVAEFRDPAEVVALTGFRQQLADQQEAPSLPAAVAPSDEELAPHRREIHQLREMIGSWRRDPQATRRTR